MATTAPYGSWQSPITAARLVERVVGLANPTADRGHRYWSEARPAEAGRVAIVCREPDGAVHDAVPADISARTTVHEYGGRCFVAREGVVWTSNFSDQRLYRAEAGSATPITPAGPARYADPILTPDGAWLVCVRERHGDDGDVVNDLVAVPTDGGAEPAIVAAGHDFFAAPRLSPDGTRLAWLAWDHPNMPWDGTWLYEAAFGVPADAPAVVAGGPEESVVQPAYSPDGVLHYVSDRTGWWNLYAGDRALAPRHAEFGVPDWVFGRSSYTFLRDGTLVASWIERGFAHLGMVSGRELAEIRVPFSELEGITAAGDRILAVAASATSEPAVVEISVPGGQVAVLKRSREASVEAAYVSVPRPVEFPTTNGATAHALYYPPTNPEFEAPPDERPPLIVVSHGGPTSAARPVLNAALQFWTTRGFAVVDVDYGGSTGYGRAYRARLHGTWGVVDVDDCANAAAWLASQGSVDGDRLLIRGGSAGGYTTLCAVTFRDVFAAGASHFGVADVSALARDTHKFESRYLDRLIGPWPAADDLYRTRSPIFHTDQLHTPLILFQGLDDRVVPPNQAEMMAAALRDKGVPHALLMFEGEQHGFRKAETIRRVAEAELAFYGAVLGFTPADDIDPIPIEGWTP